MTEITQIVVSDDEIDIRLDKFLSDKLANRTRSFVQKLIEDGFVQKEGKALAKSYKTRVRDSLTVEILAPTEIDTVAEDIPINVVYEDDDLLVVNKPKGMVVHPAAGNPSGTLVNALIFHCKDSLSGIGGVKRPGIVHRIDKDTSGLLVVAKNDEAHISLSEQIKAHSFKREYQAMVYYRVKEDSGEIDKPLGRSQKDRKKICVTDKNSKNAITYFEVIRSYEKFTHIKCQLKTGRTHQIRVHLAYIGHPVAGDAAYGPKKVIKTLNGQCLHAKSIAFIHPKTKEFMEFNSELPDYFTKFIKSLK